MNKPLVIIFFGEMGAGKNYHGQRLANYLNAPFFDGDLVATPEMIDRVAKFKPLSIRILDEYILVLSSEIIKRAKGVDNLVVAQALYLNKHRLLLKEILEKNGLNVIFCLVKPKSRYCHFKQLLSRTNGIRWVLYCLMNKPFFEFPKEYFSFNQYN